MNRDESRLISFYKMSGSGNDFIIIDNRDLSLNVGNLSTFARRVCARKISVGADGLFLIEPSASVDFKWQFFNSDGSMAEMCGNGSRCVARYAYLRGIAGEKMSFETIAGIITAEVHDDVVKVRLTDPSPLKIGQQIHSRRSRMFSWTVSTQECPTQSVLWIIWRRAPFSTRDVKSAVMNFSNPKAPTSNFACVLDRHKMKVRTYERGVEDETLACGTGRGCLSTGRRRQESRGFTGRCDCAKRRNLARLFYPPGRSF